MEMMESHLSQKQTSMHIANMQQSALQTEMQVRVFDFPSTLFVVTDALKAMHSPAMLICDQVSWAGFCRDSCNETGVRTLS